MTKIDLNRIWDEARAMGSINKDLIAAIVGMFVLLPAVLLELLVQRPEGPAEAPAIGDSLELMSQFYALNWHLMLGNALITSFAMLAMLVLLLRPGQPTVGESLRLALSLLPGYFIAYLIQGAGVGIGLTLFLLPGFYLLARLALMGSVAAAEQTANPVDLIRRSFALTSGNGWRIFFMLAILICTAFIVSAVLTNLAGLVGMLFLPEDVASLLASIVSGTVSAALAAFTALVSAAIYREAAGIAPSPWQPG